MPRYFFQQRTGPSILDDLEGSALPDVAAARAYGEMAIREILAECIRFSHDKFPDSIVILDDEGNEIGTVLLEEFLPERLKAGIR